GTALTVTATRSIVTPAPATRTARDIEAFCGALSRALGRPITPHVVDSYESLVDAMSTGQLEIAWLPPVIALRLASVGRAIPLARRRVALARRVGRREHARRLAGRADPLGPDRRVLEPARRAPARAPGRARRGRGRRPAARVDRAARGRGLRRGPDLAPRAGR